MKTVEEQWDYLTESGIATDEELQLVTSMNGYSVETMKGVLYVRTGYRNFGQREEEGIR